MFRDFATRLATLALTIAVSGTMLLSAVGPATAGATTVTGHPVAGAPRFVA